ncbi:MAG: hypothetical protein ACTSRP_00175 [Candidatus Helarchaeota archaeon]
MTTQKKSDRDKRSLRNRRGSPVVEEGLLIGIAIVGILIFLGIIFGLFDWINEALDSLFDNFNMIILFFQNI